MIPLISKTVGVGIFVVAGVRRAAIAVPGVRRLEGVVLDTLLGPAEDFDYVSVTAPRRTAAD